MVAVRIVKTGVEKITVTALYTPVMVCHLMIFAVTAREERIESMGNKIFLVLGLTMVFFGILEIIVECLG